MSSLFDDDDDDAKDEASDAVFGHNKDYAARFERRKKKQELSRLQQLHGDDEEDSEDAESEDEDAKLLTPGLDLQIFKTIDKIRSKDRGLYDKNKAWFEDEDEDEAGSAAGAGKSAAKAGKAATAKEAKVTLRTQLLEHGAAALASDDEDEDEAGGEGSGRPQGKLAYDPEQESLRRAFLQVGSGEAEEGEADDDEEAAAGLLRRKARGGDEREAEELEYKEWLRRKLEAEPKKGRVDESVTLKRYMFGDGSHLDSDERFLRDYVLNARWKRGAHEEDGVAPPPPAAAAKKKKPRPAKPPADAAPGEPPKQKKRPTAAEGLSKKASKAGISEERARAFTHLKQKGGVRKRTKTEK